jgi:hypothetical protein
MKIFHPPFSAKVKLNKTIDHNLNKPNDGGGDSGDSLNIDINV